MSTARATFTIRLTMLSDWNIGSGGGRQGSLDSTVERDADGLPYVPATTLRGIWRDSAEQAAFALDGGKGKWSEVVEHLFGSQPALDSRGAAGHAPIPARLELTDLRFPHGFRAKLAGAQKESLRAAFTQVKPGVAIEARSGRAKNDFLRFEEVARQGAVLTGKAAITLSDNAEANAALLCLAFATSRLVERIGGDRRRGCGRCAMTIDKVQGAANLGDVAAAIDRLAAIVDPQIPEAYRSIALATTFGEMADDDLVAIPLDVVVETPTIVARAVLGNVVTSLDHIPGTMLLSGVASMLQAGGLKLERISTAFAAGDIRVLPAYPDVGGKRGLPIPLVFERKKDDAGASDDVMVLLNRLLHPSPRQDNDQYKAVSRGYLAFLEGGERRPAYRELNRVTRTHNTVEDARQKPSEDVGGVYTYEAIPAGERLRAEIRLRSTLFNALTTGLSEVAISVGRARKAGCGAIRLVPQVPVRLSTAPSTDASRTEFTLYLASDLLLPGGPIGNDGSPAAFVRAAIAGVLETGITVVDGDLRTGRTEGWIARWGLPRPSYVVIRAGSTLRLKADAAVDPVRLARLAREGLGARRGEGFGHVIVDEKLAASDLSAEKLSENAAAPSADDVSVGEDVALAKFARTIEDAALRERISLRAELAAQRRGDKLKWSNTLPNMSQLGALRAMMTGMQSGADADQIRTFIEKLEADRAKKWSDAEVGPGHPLRILGQLFATPRMIWSMIDISEPDWSELLVVRPPADAQNDPALQHFAITSFLFAAMRAHKRSMEVQRTEKGAA